MFSPHVENVLPFLSNLKLSSANSFSLEESKILMFGKGLRLKLSRQKKYRHVKFESIHRQVKYGINGVDFTCKDIKQCGKKRKCLLAPLAVGQRAYVMLSVVRPVVLPAMRPSIHALTFSLNIFFSETTYRILMKFHRNVPAMVLFRIS